MQHFDLTIIGTGSGNGIADPGADPRYASMRIAICERGVFGGTCLNVGCIPTKMFVYAAEVAQTIRESSRFGIDATIDGVRWPDVVSRIFGRIDPIAAGGERYRRGLDNVTVFGSDTRFGPTTRDGNYTLRTAAGDEFTSEKVVIAAGSRVNVPPAIADCGVRFYTSDTVMRMPALPEHLVIVGGGFVAAEFAHVFSALGVRVSIVVRGHGLLTHCDADVCHPFTDIAAGKWDLHTHQNVVGSHQRDGKIVLELDDGKTLDADALLVATGRVPNGDRLDAERAGVRVEGGLVLVDEYQRTSARNVYALGDVCSRWQLKHVANHEMRVARHNLLLDWDDTAAMIASDHRFVPSAVFTDPQIAMVGLTEEEARSAGFDVAVKVQRYGDTAYGWAMEDQTGIAKVIGDRATGRILGAHFMGHQASSLIQPIVGAMSLGQTAEEVATGQYWIHPALSEVVENALLGLR